MKKLMMSLLIVGLAVALVGGGVFAYFTDVETSENNTFSAGTLDMQIKDNDEEFGNVAVSASFTSPASLAPGDIFETDPISLKNVGSIDINEIFGRFCNLVQTDGVTTDAEGENSLNNIAKYLKIVSYSELSNQSRIEGHDFYEESFIFNDAAEANSYLEYWGFPQVGYITLADLVAANPAGESAKTGLWFFDGGNDPYTIHSVPSVSPLPVNGIAKIKFKFQLLPQTPNAYQGDIATFQVDFVGAQTSTNLDNSITESVGPLYGTP